LVKRKQTEVLPTFIDDYLNQHGAHGEVTVRNGAWNTGWHHGTGFLQWTGSQAQKDALQRVSEISRSFQEARARTSSNPADGRFHTDFEQAYWRLLRAETSCNFFWGEAWVQRCHQDLDDATRLLNEASSRLAG